MQKQKHFMENNLNFYSTKFNIFKALDIYIYMHIITLTFVPVTITNLNLLFWWITIDYLN